MLSPRGATALGTARSAPRPDRRGTGGVVSGPAPDQAEGRSRRAARARQEERRRCQGCCLSDPPGGGAEGSGAGLRAHSWADPLGEPRLPAPSTDLLTRPFSVVCVAPPHVGVSQMQVLGPQPKPSRQATSPGSSPALLCRAVPARPLVRCWHLSHLGSCTFKIHLGRYSGLIPTSDFRVLTYCSPPFFSCWVGQVRGEGFSTKYFEAIFIIKNPFLGSLGHLNLCLGSNKYSDELLPSPVT